MRGKSGIATLVGIIILTILLVGCGRDRPQEKFKPLELTDCGRQLTDTETKIINGIVSLPDYLETAVAADLDGDGRDEIIILAKEFDSVLHDNMPPVSGVVRIESGQVHYLYRFPPNYVNHHPLVADLNGDGVPDLVYTAWNGGNCFGCSPQVVVWWDGTAFRHQDIGEWKNIYDFDGDGAFELETTVDIPEASKCCMACGLGMSNVREILYAPSMVLGWRNGIWEEISKEVPSFFRDIRVPALAVQRLELEKAKRDVGTDKFAVVVDCMLGCLEMMESRAMRLAEPVKFREDFE